LADCDHILIVPENLIRNAAATMHFGGRLSLTSRRPVNDLNGPVGDAGVGIPLNEFACVTDMLSSTKARGMGFGLALSRTTLEKNRGSVGLASEPGVSTTFTIHLATSV
jgi:two-component system sensor kinase FixL